MTVGHLGGVIFILGVLEHMLVINKKTK